jgi:hypothetical protein
MSDDALLAARVGLPGVPGRDPIDDLPSSVAFEPLDYLPTGGVELQCPIGATPRLVGPLTRAKVEILPPNLTIVGARFWPGAASPLLGVPADELVNQLMPFGDVPR